MNDYRPNVVDLSAVRAGEQRAVLWIDRSIGLNGMFEEADRRLQAAERLCYLPADGGGIMPDCASDLAGAVAVLVEDARSLIAAHHVMALDNFRTLAAYAEEIKAIARQAKCRTGGKA